MPNAILIGSIVDVRKRVRFIPRNAYLTSCRDAKVVVFNDQGNFVVPNLEAGQTYEFLARNGEVVKRWLFTPKPGQNHIQLTVPTKPARVTSPRARKSLAMARQANA